MNKITNNEIKNWPKRAQQYIKRMEELLHPLRGDLNGCPIDYGYNIKRGSNCCSPNFNYENCSNCWREALLQEKPINA